MTSGEWDLDECKRWLGIGEKIYVKNQGSVEDFKEWQALDKKYVGFDNHACLIEMCEKLRDQLAVAVEAVKYSNDKFNYLRDNRPKEQIWAWCDEAFLVTKNALSKIKGDQTETKEQGE